LDIGGVLRRLSQIEEFGGGVATLIVI